MAEITLRVPLGRPLTYQEVDDNFRSVQELTLLAQQFALTAQEASTLADEAKNEAIAAKDEALTASGSAASDAQRAEDAADRAEAIAGFDGLHNTLAGRNEPNAHDASAIGFKQDGEGAVERNLADKAQEWVSVKDFGAAGDGITNDQDAFGYLPKGAVIDLNNLKYAVGSVPKNQLYTNGSFSVDGFTRDASILPNPKTFDPKFAKFGGQLGRLRDDLMNPLVQFTGIVFIGDSNTWGVGTGESAPTQPRNQSLDDPRDFFGTGTWVNNFKRYIGANYFIGSQPIVSNWHSSPSGEAIVEHTREILIYPFSGYFEEEVSLNASSTQREREGCILGWQYIPRVGPVGSYVSVIFPFTGKSFDMVYTATPDGADYELIVDDVSLGVFPSRGTSVVRGVSRTHSFDFIKDKIVEIRVIPPIDPGAYGTFPMYWEAIRIKKKCRITNNGIIGADTSGYRLYNLVNRKAVLPDDGYTFVQIGGNDRIIRYDRKAGGVAPFFDSLKAMIDVIPETSQIIMMSSNPGTEAGNYSFTRMDVRNVIRTVAKERALDFIDNYSCFQNLDFSVYTSDGTHMNVLGNAILTKNLIGALESS